MLYASGNNLNGFHSRDNSFDLDFITTTLITLKRDLQISFVDKRAKESLHQHNIVGNKKKKTNISDELNDVYGELLRRENLCSEVIEMSGRHKCEIFLEFLMEKTKDLEEHLEFVEVKKNQLEKANEAHKKQIMELEVDLLIDLFKYRLMWRRKQNSFLMQRQK